MTGRCNARTTTSSNKGTDGYFKMWLNKKYIANPVSIPILEPVNTSFPHTPRRSGKCPPPTEILFFSSMTQDSVLECHTLTSVNTRRIL